VIKAEQDLPVTEGRREEKVGKEEGEEMTQTMYAHVNKGIIIKKVRNISQIDYMSFGISTELSPI
jgi:hypothetical protein